MTKSPGHAGASNSPDIPVQLRDVLASVLQYGDSSTCFLTLYGGFSYFKFENEGIACILPYVETPTAWVGASGPMGPRESHDRAIQAFMSAAKAAGKAGAFLPVSRSLAEKSKTAGLETIQIGSEPWIKLSDFDSQRMLAELRMARIIKKKGAKVETFHPFQVQPRTRDELDALIRRWLKNHPSIPLSFLNQMAPWLHSDHKRYFMIRLQGRILGFVGAVPVPARKGWYLVDLIRSPDAPPGTTELLVIEAMARLKAEGALEVTLGMSPLVPVSDDERKKHPRVYRAFDRVFNQSGSLYGFKSLYDYKCKFGPAKWEPQYAIASPKLGVRIGYGIFLAHFPQGMAAAGLQLALKKLSQWPILPDYPRFLTDRIVARSPSVNWIESIIRRKAVLTLAAVNILFYFATIEEKEWVIRPRMEATYGFSVKRLLSDGSAVDKVIDLILSSFLHWNPMHLITNLLMMLVLVGFLELIAGSLLVMVSYGMGIVFSNPVASLLIYGSMKLAGSPSAVSFANQIDVGCSLGVFACLGAIAHFLKHSLAILLILTIGVVAYSAISSNWMNLNHIASLFIGLLCGHFYAKKK